LFAREKLSLSDHDRCISKGERVEQGEPRGESLA
jgi:hypothetical protein